MVLKKKRVTNVTEGKWMETQVGQEKEAERFSGEESREEE